MRVRDLRDDDIPALQQMADSSGFPYPSTQDPHIEQILVVVDDDDRPIMACAARRLLEMYLWCGEIEHPALALHAIRLIHEAMGDKLRVLGYDSVDAFLPPGIKRSFGRRLERSFGWLKNWDSWCKHF